MIPYARQWIDDDDVEAVVRTLRSDMLTSGPMIPAFEAALSGIVGSRHAVAVSSGTAALHAAMFAAGVGLGDEVIVPAITFAATANCVVHQGARPVFADVDPNTLLIDPSDVVTKIGKRTKAVTAVDYAGHPCDYDELRAIAEAENMMLVADSCHALGARWKGEPVGSLASMTAFSFHPVKHVATGEGGAIATDDPVAAERMRRFRNHGINADFKRREAKGDWVYEITDLGYNYRLTDIQCALGLSQLKKLGGWIRRRQEIAARYDNAFSHVPEVTPLTVGPNAFHAYHLYVIKLTPEDAKPTRREVFSTLRSAGIGVNVHYMPVYLHPYYRRELGTGPGLCPNAEQAYESILSLPMYPKLTNDEVDTVITEVCEAVI